MTKKKGIVTKWVITIVLFLFGLICIYPFLFTVSSAFKPTGEVLSTPLQLIPEHFTLQNMKTVFANPYFDFGQWYMNTVVMTMWSLVLPAAVDVYFVFRLRQAFIAIPDSIRWSPESGRPRRARCARPPASACTISMPESGCMSRAVRCASSAKRNGAPP